MPFFSPLKRQPKNMAHLTIPLMVVLCLKDYQKGMVITSCIIPEAFTVPPARRTV